MNVKFDIESSGSGPKVDESSVMMSGVVPMSIEYEENPIWISKDLNSKRAFRPWRIKFHKENAETCKVEVKELIDQMRALDGHTYYSEEHGFYFRFKTYFTMIDSGAVNKASGNTDNHKCRICRKRMEEYRYEVCH